MHTPYSQYSRSTVWRYVRMNPPAGAPTRFTYNSSKATAAAVCGSVGCAVQAGERDACAEQLMATCDALSPRARAAAMIGGEVR